MVVLVVIALATPIPIPSGPLNASVTLPPRLPTVTTGHCWRSLLKERKVSALFEVAAVELCWRPSQYSPALRNVLSGTEKNLGPVAKLLQLPAPLVVLNDDVPPVESVTQESWNTCEVLEYPRLAEMP